MSLPAPAMAGGGGMLASNVLDFARALRRTGLPVGPADLLAALAAVQAVDIGSREQVRAALRCTLIHRREHHDLFDQAFSLFWRDPQAGRLQAAQEQPGSRRLAEALARPHTPQPPAPGGRQIDAAMTVSDRERLQTLDFEAMSAAEIAAARADIGRLVLPLDQRRTRRRRPDRSGKLVDLRATLRASLRHGGEILDLATSRRASRPPPLVVLCDISGSMGRYVQILLYFLHAVANQRDRVQTFLFGTRLSNVTRALRHRDAEAAFQLVAQAVPDWSGGTRIGETLGMFNRRWARRVLAQGAVVLLVTDGLDRDGAAGLAEAMQRLHHSCARLVWLNPLLRWDGFAPKSQGIRAMLPHVDAFRPVHNLASLRALVQSLSRPVARREMDRWRIAS